MAKRNKRRVAEDDLYDVPDDDGADETPAPKKRGGWLFRAFLGLVLLGVLVFFAPTIIVSTGLWKTALGYAAPQLAGKIDASSISLSWMSPIVVNELKVSGDAGEPIAAVKQIRTEKSLLDIVRAWQDPGRITITQPVVRIVVRDEGSNVEDLLAKLSTGDDAGSSAAPQIAVGVTIEQGLIEIIDDKTKVAYHVENLNADANWTAAADQPKQAKFSAVVRQAAEAGAPPASPQSVGEIQGELEWSPGVDGSLGTGRAGMLVSEFPADIATPFLRRAQTGLAIGGSITCTVLTEWSNGGEQLTADLSKLSSRNLVVQSTAMAAGEMVRVAVEESSAKIVRKGEAWSLAGISLRSNLASLSGRGSIAIPATISTVPVVVAPDGSAMPAPTSTATSAPIDWQKVARDSDLQLEGSVDLAAIAQQLPATLHMKESARITSGTLAISATSQGVAEAKRFSLTAKTSKLQGEAAGRQVAWDQPLEVSALVRPEFSLAAIEQVFVKSSFLDLQGEGDLRAGRLIAKADLDKLASELSRLIDLASVELAGQMNLDVRWQQQPGETWQLTADGSLDKLNVILPGLLPWHEDQLKITASAEGLPSATGLSELSAAQLSVRSGTDAFTANLTGVVKNPSPSALWPVNWKLEGDLATWMPRVQTFLSLGDWIIAGVIDGSGGGAFSSQQIELGETSIIVSQLMATGSGLAIREPRVEVATSGVVNLASFSASFPSTTVRSSSIALRAENINIATASPGVAVTGLVEYRGDLTRLRKWFEKPAEPFESQLTGELVGRVELKYIGNVIDATIDTSANNVQYVWLEQPPVDPAARPGSRPLEPVQRSWSEKTARITGAATYDPTSDKAQLASMNLLSSFASVQMSGTMEKLTSEMLVDLKGETVVVMEQLTQMLSPILGPTFNIAGQDRRPFSITGPLLQPATDASSPTGFISKSLKAEAGIGWDSIRYMGLVGGQGLLSAKLADGVLFLGPIDMMLSEGQFIAAPRITLGEPQPRLIMDKGPLLTKVRISPDMCRDWLKFVAPVVADATEAQGTFSVELVGVSVPLFSENREKEITAGGLLTIHAAQIGPGPLAEQYLGVIKQLKSAVENNPLATAPTEPRGWIILPEQRVQVEVVDGRVYHRGLTMTVKEVALITQGSVGLDQSLEMLSEIPIPDKWVDGKPLLVGLKGQRISIPIRGQINKPQLDGTAIGNLAKQFANRAVQGLLEQGLNKGLEKIFGQPKTPAPSP
ncbi:hypothetical protein Psta_2133 [Pirellula staleyi DSM 6068]|uniref:AsmA-like C-terminal domain-containing protein n=1 Tax=Pirellula staleyi (strain ATCC 27377 / DSM 6068 / ICPB 4128) TaxID=530564 RepID=D2R1T8_PIRSD|nr:hypothetical protein [Pirellula staleyi]ADB16807.1 hypothetical protein Psta_2133 [Pirellula staleyi DSM 6068]